MIGAAADDARAEPLEIRAGGGNVGLAVNGPSAVGSEEFAKVFAGRAADACAAVRQLVGPRPHLEIFFGIEIRAGFEQSAVEAAFGENVCGHAAAGAGANDANVVLLGGTNDLWHS